MEDVQRRAKQGKPRSMAHFNPALPSTRRPDQATLGRSGSSGLSQSTAAQRRLNQQSMDDEDSIRSTGQVRSASGSSRAGGAGPSREGRLAGGATGTSAKGKEREHARLETSSPDRRRREKEEDDDDGRATQGVARRTLARSSALKELSDDSDDDFPSHVHGALKRSPPRKPVTATTKFNRTTSPQKGRKRPSRSDDDDDDDELPKSTLASTLSLARPPTPDPPLPNFKKKSDKSVPQRTLSNIPSPVVPERRPVEPVLSKPRPAIASSSSSALVYDLDSPKRSIVKRNSDPPSSPPVDRSAKARSRASSTASSSSRRERDQVEDDLTPKKKSSRPKPKVKLQPVQSDAAPLGVTNPFGVAKTQPTSPSASERTPSTSAKALDPVKATPAPFPWEASTSSTSSTSKPSGLKARGSNQLPASEEDEETTTAGVQFLAKAKRKVKLTPAELEARRLATKESVSQEMGDSSSEDESAKPRKKKITILASLTPFQAMAERSQTAKVAKEKREKLYGKDDGGHETDRPHPNPRLLCVFCSELLPAAPSAKLLALIARLKPLGRAAPTTYNKCAVSLSMSQSINVCTLHRSETSHLPSALKNGWPTEIDWEDAQRRVRKPAMLLELDKIVLAKESSVFYGFAREQAEKVGSVMARTAKGQFEVATKSQPGYYGEIGQILFHQVLSSAYMPSKSTLASPDRPVLTAALTSPLTPSDFVYFVLVPEVAVRLIQQDLNLKRSVDAFDVFMKSRAYGNSRFAAEEGEIVGGALMQGWDHQAEELAHGEDDGVAISRRRRESSTTGSTSTDTVTSSSELKRTRPATTAPPPSGPSSIPKLDQSMPSSTSKTPTPANRPIHSFFAPPASKLKPKLDAQPSPKRSRPTSTSSSVPQKAVKRPKATAPILDLDSDDAKENVATKKKRADRDKTVTPPAPKKQKQKKAADLYVDIDSDPEDNGESQGRSPPAGGAKGKLGDAKAQAKVLGKSSASMQRTESDRFYWPSSDSFDIPSDFDPDTSIPAAKASARSAVPNITPASIYDDDDDTF